MATSYSAKEESNPPFGSHASSSTITSSLLTTLCCVTNNKDTASCRPHSLVVSSFCLACLHHFPCATIIVLVVWNYIHCFQYTVRFILDVESCKYIYCGYTVHFFQFFTVVLGCICVPDYAIFYSNRDTNIVLNTSKDN